MVSKSIIVIIMIVQYFPKCKDLCSSFGILSVLLYPFSQLPESVDLPNIKPDFD